MSIQDVKFYVVIDVSSSHLDLFFPDTGKSERLKNNAEANWQALQSNERQDGLYVRHGGHWRL